MLIKYTGKERKNRKKNNSTKMDAYRKNIKKWNYKIKK